MWDLRCRQDEAGRGNRPLLFKAPVGSTKLMK
jgi:hypothetical protein